MLAAAVSSYAGIFTILVNGNVALLARAKFHSTKIQKCSNPHNLSIGATAAQQRRRIFVTLPGDVSCCPFCLFFACNSTSLFALALQTRAALRRGRQVGTSLFFCVFYFDT